jgi:hypothetical protein
MAMIHSSTPPSGCLASTQCTLLRRLATLPEDELQGDPRIEMQQAVACEPDSDQGVVRPAAPDLGNLLRLVNPDHNRVLPIEKHDHAALRILRVHRVGVSQSPSWQP